MIVEKPFTAKNDEKRDVTRLFYDGGRYCDYHIRGAISFPDGQYDGYALLAGQKLTTEDRVIFQFEEVEFLSIDHEFHPNRSLNRLGARDFFLKCRSLYCCWRFFHLDRARKHEHDLTYKREFWAAKNKRVISRESSIMPVPDRDDDSLDALVSMALRTKRIVMDGNSILAQHLREHRDNPAADPKGGVTALRTLLAGLDKAPWRDPGGWAEFKAYPT